MLYDRIIEPLIISCGSNKPLLNMLHKTYWQLSTYGLVVVVEIDNLSN